MTVFQRFATVLVWAFAASSCATSSTHYAGSKPRLKAIPQIDSKLRGRLPARRIEVSVDEEGVYDFDVDVDDDTNVYCSVYPEGAFAAQSVLEQRNAMVVSLESDGFALVGELTHAGSILGRPYLSRELQFTASAQEQLLTEIMWFRGASSEQLCTMARVPESRKRMQDFATAFLTMVEVGVPRVSTHQEVSVVEMSGSTLGVTYVDVYFEDGIEWTEQGSSVLLQKSVASVHYDDSLHIEKNESGEVSWASYLRTSTGRPDSNVELNLDENILKIEGTLNGDSIEYQSKLVAPWFSYRSRLDKICAHLERSGGDDKLALWSYSPSLDIANLSKTLLVGVGKKGDSFIGNLHSNKATVSVSLLPDGVFSEVRIPSGITIRGVEHRSEEVGF